MPRQRQREVYGDRIGEAAELVLSAYLDRDGDGLRTAVDRALALRQPAGEDPVHWLCAALSALAAERGVTV
ncbi:hypothetical protein ABT341_00350 [Pseudonocardia alni]|uniref:hypothetical protein n=1 Tax=Pseudonocardia alni TaxID=33907 RepID=UPI003324EF39